MKLHIQGMACEHCRRRVEGVLKALPGVEVTVDLSSGIAEVTAATATVEALRAAVEEAGFTVSSVEE